MKYWSLDYYRRHNWIDTKYIKDEFSQGAINNNRLDYYELIEVENDNEQDY